MSGQNGHQLQHYNCCQSGILRAPGSGAISSLSPGFLSFLSRHLVGISSQQLPVVTLSLVLFTL